MKNLLFYLILAGFTVFTSCKRDETPLNTQTLNNLEEQFLSSDLNDDVLDEVEYTLDLYWGELKSGISDCRTVTVVPLDRVTWPKTITIDFGTEGCLVRDSVIKKGKIIINQSAPQFGPAWTKVITFDNYYVNGNKVEGTHTVNFTREGNPTWTVTVAGGQVTTPEGVIRTREALHIRVQTRGIETPRDRSDDAFQLTGNASGTRRDGKEFSWIITDPLVISNNCRWIRKGTRVISLEGLSDITVDYGSGDCDNKAIASQDGVTKEITLRGRRW